MLNTNPTYRTFEATDQTDLCELLATLGYQVSVDDLIQRISDIRGQGGEVIVAETHGKVVGCINAMIDTRLAEGTYGEIVSLVVAEDRRGLGIGKGLISAAETWLSAHCQQIRIRANVVREDAHAFYETLGYQAIKSQKILTKSL